MTVTLPSRVAPPRTPHPAAVARELPGLAGVAPVDAAEGLRDLPGVALLESARLGRRGRWTFLTADPVAIVETPAGRDEPTAGGRDPSGGDPFVDARRLLARLDHGPVETGRETGAAPAHLPPFTGGLVGYLSYDLVRRLERLPAIAMADQDLPLLRLALHDWVVAFDRRTGSVWLAGRALDRDTGRLAERLTAIEARLSSVGRWLARAASGRGRGGPGGVRAAGLLEPFRCGMSRAGWIERVEAVRAAIAAGEIYQANLARRLEVPFGSDPWPLYRRLRDGDPALFAAWLDLGASRGPAGGRRAILSASPEPFLAVDARRRVTTDPIKGTRPLAADAAARRSAARDLLSSAKDRAENVMIVDVLRNDLGRVCVPGSVRVPRLLRLERTAAVQHLVTTVSGVLRPGIDPFDLLRATFPGGSVTGAPKIRAMELIETLEPVRRGPYTGALAWVGADGRMGSSLLIRTFVADGRRLTLHVGGGITWRSDPVEEWDETRAKAAGPLRALGASEAER